MIFLCDCRVHGILLARILEWVAFPFTRRSSQHRSSTLQVGSLPAEPLGRPRILEWVAYPFCSRSSWPGNRTRVSCIAGRFFINWAIREAQARLLQGQSRSPQQDGRRGKLAFRIKSHTCQRLWEGSNKTLCVARPVFEPPVEVLVSSGLRQGPGHWVQLPGSHCLWYKPSWRRSPLTPPKSCQADNPQTAEQLCQRNSRTVKKVLGPRANLPPWGSGKGTENAQRIWLWRPVGYRTYTGLGKQTLGAQTKLCVHQDPEERSSDPTRDWPRLACECPRVCGRGVCREWPAAGLGALSVAAHAQDLLKEVAIIFITSTIVWPQVKQQGGNRALPINRKLD